MFSQIKIQMSGQQAMIKLKYKLKIYVSNPVCYNLIRKLFSLFENWSIDI